MNLCSNKNNSNDDADKKYNADHGDDDGNHSDHEIITTMTIIITTVAMQGRSQRGVPGGPTPLSVLPQYNTHWYGLSTRIEHFSIKTITCPPLPPPSPLQGKILAKPLQWQRQ